MKYGILGSHVVSDIDVGLLGCNAVRIYRQIPKFIFRDLCLNFDD